MPESSRPKSTTFFRVTATAIVLTPFLLFAYCVKDIAPRIYHANFYKNPIANKTYSVDFEIEVEGETIRLTRNYACDDQVKYTDFANSYYHQFPSNRIVSHRLQSGAGIYVAVPNACRYISFSMWKGAWCYEGKPHGVYTYTRPADCSGENPVIAGHVPMVIWTPDFDDPHTLYANTTAASFDSPGSKVRRAEATITIKDGLEVSPPDAERWIEVDIHQKYNSHEIPPAYFGINRHQELITDCRSRATANSLQSMRNGQDLNISRNFCISPADSNGDYIPAMEGILRFGRENSNLTPEEVKKLRDTTRSEARLNQDRSVFGILFLTREGGRDGIGQ